MLRVLAQISRRFLTGSVALRRSYRPIRTVGFPQDSVLSDLLMGPGLNRPMVWRGRTW